MATSDGAESLAEAIFLEADMVVGTSIAIADAFRAAVDGDEGPIAVL